MQPCREQHSPAFVDTPYSALSFIPMYHLLQLYQAILPTSFSAPRVGHTALGITLLAKAYLLGLPFFMHQLDKAHATGKINARVEGRICSVPLSWLS